MRKRALEVATMLMRTDPFRELDRFTRELPGTAARPTGVPIDAWRDGDQFIVEFDLPGVDANSLDLDIENDVVTVRAERPPLDPGREMLAAERPRGVFSRQLLLGNNLDTGRITADYQDGVLRLVIPVAEKAKPRKIAVGRSAHAKAIVEDSKTIDEDGDPVAANTKEPVAV